MPGHNFHKITKHFLKLKECWTVLFSTSPSKFFGWPYTDLRWEMFRTPLTSAVLIIKLCTAAFAPNKCLLFPTLLAHPLSILSYILSIFFLLLLSCVKYRNLYCFLQFGPLSQITLSPTVRITKECTYAAAMLDFIEKARHVHTSVSLKLATRK